MEQTLLFNHIPKTGGTTLRVVFNKVYGTDRVFFIESKNISSSLKNFKKLNESYRKKYKVIAGHGASYFSVFVENPFHITILREPIELFISQYDYLKQSPNSVFQEEVNKLKSIVEYIDFALLHGQDNLLTRYLSESVNWLIDPSQPIPEMETEGEQLLAKAKTNLRKYDAVLSLNQFDAGVYSLKEHLGWEKIPIYRPANKTARKGQDQLHEPLLEKLKSLLRYDIELYEYFLKEELDYGLQINRNKLSVRRFLLRQKAINFVFG